MLSLEIENIINHASELVNYTKNAKGVQVSYDNKLKNDYLVQQGLDGELREWAEYFGIDFDATGYTFNTSYTKTAEGFTKFVSMPRVCMAEGVPCLVWGHVNQPLANIKNRYVFAKDGKFNHIVAGEEGDPNQVKLYVSLEDKATEPGVLNKAKRDGNFEELAKYLAYDNNRTHPTKVKKGVKLLVYRISPKDQYNKYQLAVEGHGLVTTNTRLTKQVENLLANWSRKPELKHYPLFVKFGKDFQSRDGKPCVEADLIQDIPVADCSLDDLMDF